GRITLELSALRIGRFAIDSRGNQTGAVQHSGLAQILYIDWMLWRDAVQFSPRRQTLLGKLRRCPATTDNNPCARGFVLGSSLNLFQAVGERSYRFPVQFGVPCQTRDRRMHM